MNASRFITGIIGFLIGVSIIVGGIIFLDIAMIIFGLVITIISIYIGFNKKEDEIEQIKEEKKEEKRGNKK